MDSISAECTIFVFIYLDSTKTYTFYRVFFVQPACGDMTFAIIPHYRKLAFHTDYLKKAIVFLARYHDTFILFT